MILALLAVIALDAGLPAPRGCRDRACARGRSTSDATPVAPFVLSQDFNFVASSVISPPPCMGGAWGTVDPHCVMQCMAISACDFECYTNDGGTVSGMTQGSGQACAPVTIGPAPDGGYFQALSHIDDTSTSAAMPHINSAALRTMFGGNHTIVVVGYSTRDVNANGGWWGMITDGTNGMQLRHSGSQFEYLENPGGILAASIGTCWNGWCVMTARNTAGSLTVRAAGTPSSATAGATTGAITGTNNYVFAGGITGCCTTSGSQGGKHWVTTFYDESKSAAWIDAAERGVFGALTLKSGGNDSVGTAAATLMGRDDLSDAGLVTLFDHGAYIMSPVKGAHAQNGFQNWFASDPLAAATWVDVGTPVITSNASAGPFYYYKYANEGDLITTANASALDGKRSLAMAVAADGGFGNGWANCSAYLSQGTAGVTRTKAEFKFITDGTFDAGFTTCNVSGLDGTPRRYPLASGCWAWIDNATSVKCDILVGNATPDVGSITVYQAQLTPTLFMESPTVDGTAKGANWPELDGGGVPFGNTKGKIQAIFQIPYATMSFSANVLASVVGTYIFDAYHIGTSHDVLEWITQNVGADGGVQSSAESLLYGISGTGENRFRVTPTQFSAATNYVWSYEWRPVGGGCQGTARLDVCADPTTCIATTIIASAARGDGVTPGLGECPSSADVIDLGTRISGSSTSTVDILDLKVYN